MKWSSTLPHTDVSLDKEGIWDNDHLQLIVRDISSGTRGQCGYTVYPICFWAIISDAGWLIGPTVISLTGDGNTPFRRDQRGTVRLNNYQPQDPVSM